jgi:hypothetical protein
LGVPQFHEPAAVNTNKAATDTRVFFVTSHRFTDVFVISHRFTDVLWFRVVHPHVSVAIIFPWPIFKMMHSVVFKSRDFEVH